MPTPKYLQVAEMLKHGASREAIMEDLELTRRQVYGFVHAARQLGVLPPPTYAHHRTAIDRYQHFLGKGAVPRRGHIGDILRALPPDDLDKILRYTKPGDETLARVIARIVEEHLNANPKG